MNGTTLHYVVGRKGPLVVLLHGFPYTWAIWRRAMRMIALAAYTVIAPYLRGLGASEKTHTGYSKVNCAEDVRSIAKLHGHGAVNLVGMDIGAMVAYAYASRHPGAVRRLIFAESIIPGFGLEEFMNPAQGGYWHFGFHAQVEVASMLIKGKEAAYLLPWYQMMSASEYAIEQELGFCRATLPRMNSLCLEAL